MSPIAYQDIVHSLDLAAIDWLEKRKDVDGKRIGIVGSSLGGYYVARAAAYEPRLKATVAWGAVAGDTHELFTTLSAPVMTRLRQAERQVLDTLVAAGVARSRSDALGRSSYRSRTLTRTAASRNPASAQSTS